MPLSAPGSPPPLPLTYPSPLMWCLDPFQTKDADTLATGSAIVWAHSFLPPPDKNKLVKLGINLSDVVVTIPGGRIISMDVNNSTSGTNYPDIPKKGYHCLVQVILDAHKVCKHHPGQLNHCNIHHIKHVNVQCVQL